MLVGTGLALYLTLLTLVVTGFLQRFKFFTQKLKSWRYIHISMALALYLIIVVHLIRGLLVPRVFP